MRKLVLFSSLLAGCASGDFYSRLDVAKEVRALEPAPYRVALAPPTLGEEVSGAALQALDRDTLQQELREGLERLGCASDLVCLDSADVAAADEARADILLCPRLTAVRFGHEGATAQGLLSTMLWAVTWIGGLFVPDNAYIAGVQIDWRLVNPHNGQPVATLPGRMRSCRLAFTDRNPWVSWGTIQSVVLPPVFTSDDPRALEESLAAAGLAFAAVDASAYLKSGLAGEERELLGELRIESPRNGATLKSDTKLRAELVAHEALSELVLVVGEEVVSRQTVEDLPSRGQQQVGARTFQVALPEIQLRPADGDVRVVVEFVAGGRRSSRTLIYHSEQKEVKS